MIDKTNIDRALLKDKAISLLQSLLRFDTTNPPGQELPAAQFIACELTAAGFEPVVLESEKDRGNVIARLAASRPEAAPLLLYGHLDVVPAEPALWKYPPFSGVMAEGYIWGRGAVDMKHTVAAQLAIMLALKQAEIPLKRDIIFAAVADEEENGKKGMRWLLQNHPQLLDAQYALSEVGGFTLTIGGKRFYVCETGEKGLAWIQVKVKGTPGHGSLPTNDSAIIKLCQALLRLEQGPSLIYLSNTTRAMLDRLVKGQTKWLDLIKAHKIQEVLDSFPPEPARMINAIVRNTITVTGLKAGYKNNVIPGQAEAILDCRFAVGQTVTDVIEEIKHLLGDEIQAELEIIDTASPSESEIETPFFRSIEKVLKQYDQEAKLVPMLFNGSTDGAFLRQRGVICYGFHPLPYPEDFNFLKLMHAHNERIPVQAFCDSLDILLDIVLDFCS